MRNGFQALFLGLVLAACGPAAAQAATASAPADGAVEWRAGNTTYLAGRDFTIDRKVEGSLTATGETVSVSDDTEIKRDLWVAARRVAVEGKVGGALAIRAQEALVNGEVKGDVSFYGVHLVFGPDARIGGDVHYYAALPAEIDAGAKIRGAMKSSVLRDTPDASGPPQGGWRGGWATPGYRLSLPGAIFFGVLAGIVALVAPTAMPRLREAGAAQPLLAFAIGFLWLVGTPVLAVISALTIIGLPLAILVVLLWPIGILAGLVAAILALGDVFTSRMRERYDRTARVAAGIVLGTFLIWTGISFPALGPIVWLAAVTFGVGAIALSGRAKIDAL
ncbi:MAG: polymer-forming cytoskeletal protein [Parvibaculum sp.]|uniref:polymer-forming cytoskeletal protein n=1 Tax=Parvibaculum sp. TaxID=2024848 RepID=UPI0025EEE769|nr:polymer-forming cytoskeletal protein [Parvibaculum sp.]MCE9648996.1 polymer-forming cytoskeletal protein [Parvibaculum sp.]